jgi:hypothetical protein
MTFNYDTNGFINLIGSQTRTYTYAYDSFLIENIKQIRIEKDGSHTLVKYDGSYAVMAPGWLSVEASPDVIVV